MKKISIVILCLTLAFNYCALAQDKQPERVEIASLSEAIDFNVVPVGKNGLLAFYIDKSTKGEDNRTWIFKKFDTDLKEQWTKTYNVDKKKQFNSSDFNNGNLYLLFDDYRNGEISIIIINTATNQLTEYNDNLEDKFRVESFKVNSDVAYFNGYLKRKPHLCDIDLKRKTHKAFDLEGYGKNVVLHNMEYDEQSGSINVSVTVTDKKDRKYIVKSINAKQVDHDFTLGVAAEDKWLLNASVRKLSDNKQLVIGTYSKAKAGGSQGVYLAKFNAGQREFIKFYSFIDFENFLKYLPEKAQERVEKRIEKQKEKGKDPIVSYQLLVHDIIVKNGEYIFVGEAYYPVYHTESHTVTRLETYSVPGVNGQSSYQTRPVTTTEYKQVFDGYRFTHALVAGFDEQGAKKWDNCFEMGDIQTYSLREKIKVDQSENKIGMAYVIGNSIVSKYIDGNKVVEGKKTELYKTTQANDKVKATYSTIEAWYDRFFIGWGFQRIKNTDNEKAVRKVYFANKFGY